MRRRVLSRRVVLNKDFRSKTGNGSVSSRGRTEKCWPLGGIYNIPFVPPHCKQGNTARSISLSPPLFLSPCVSLSPLPFSLSGSLLPSFTKPVLYIVTVYDHLLWEPPNNCPFSRSSEHGTNSVGIHSKKPYESLPNNEQLLYFLD